MTLDQTPTSSIFISSAKMYPLHTKQSPLFPAHSRTSTKVQKKNMVQLDSCSHTHSWPGQLQPQWGIFISTSAAGSTAAPQLG